MVRLQQCVRKTLSFVLVGVACQALAVIAQQYRPDDPIQKVPEVGSAQNSGVQSINAIYDFMYHSAKYKTPPATPSLSVNTLGEVPDSSWFTNRMTDWALEKPTGFYLSSFRCVTAFVAREVAAEPLFDPAGERMR